MVKHLK